MHILKHTRAHADTPHATRQRNFRHTANSGNANWYSLNLEILELADVTIARVLSCIAKLTLSEN